MRIQHMVANKEKTQAENMYIAATKYVKHQENKDQSFEDIR